MPDEANARQSSSSVLPAVGAWRLRIPTKRGEEWPVVAFAADGTGIFQSPEGPLPVDATYDGKDVSFTVGHKTVMTDFTMRFRGTVDGNRFDGALLTAGGPHAITGERVG